MWPFISTKNQHMRIITILVFYLFCYELTYATLLKATIIFNIVIFSFWFVLIEHKIYPEIKQLKKFKFQNNSFFRYEKNLNSKLKVILWPFVLFLCRILDCIGIIIQPPIFWTFLSSSYLHGPSQSVPSPPTIDLLPGPRPEPSKALLTSQCQSQHWLSELCHSCWRDSCSQLSAAGAQLRASTFKTAWFSGSGSRDRGCSGSVTRSASTISDVSKQKTRSYQGAW